MANGDEAGLTADGLARSLEGRVARPTLTLRYRVGLVLVALATLLLPIVYLALVSLAAYAVYLHLAFDTWLLKTTDVTIVHFIGYLGPAVVGAAVVFFMCKPLL